MRGFKVLNKGLINRYGFQYELNKKYILDGELKWSENGFHFCKYPEDTLRYIDAFNNDFSLTEVEGTGDIVEYDDDYNGYYDMYASSEMTIIRVVPNFVFFQMVVNSRNDARVKRLIQTMRLNEEQCAIINILYPELKQYIDYYQHNDQEAFSRKLKKDF